MSEHLEQVAAAEKKVVRRKRGEGRIWQMGRIWWIQYYAHGQQVRESSKSETRGKAAQLLRARLNQSDEELSDRSNAKRIRYEQLRDALNADYQTNRRKWLRIGKDGEPYICGISHLDDFFAGYRAGDITTDDIREFIKIRQDAGAAAGTINRSLALLRRMFNLAVQDDKLASAPHFPMLKEASPRKGFVDYATFRTVRKELPEYLRTVATLAHESGMRLGEILRLRWENVSLLDSQIRLDPGATKNDDARVIPLTGELLEMLKIERQKNPKGESVFIHNGQPIQSFYKAWKSACKRAGVPNLLFHDLRRTGVRNLIRAGVPEKVAMQISGHRTRAVFDRYNIVSERDLQDASKKLETYLTGQENGANSGQIAVPVKTKGKADRPLTN